MTDYALLLITDGARDEFSRTLASLWEMWRGPEPTMVVVDDSGDPDYNDFVHHALRRANAHIISLRRRTGFAAAIETGWRYLRSVPTPAWVFHLEDDFVFKRPFSAHDMAEVMATRPYLVQMSLLRQPCNAEERAAGGLAQLYADDFVFCTDGRHRWMEQRRYFTTNPSLYRGDFAIRGWPQVERSEGVLTRQLLDHGYAVPDGERLRVVKGEDVRFGVWGGRDDGPWVDHIGVRTGTGY